MTSERRSKRGRSAASSSAQRDAAKEKGEFAALASRYERACRLLGLPLDGGCMVVACSGGADSAAALLLLRRVAPRAQLIACYVDHRRRPSKSIARDVAAVRAQARAARASVRVRRVDLGRVAGSPEERARIARYGILEAIARRHGAKFVITGHQQDDLAETSLLALVRGSGIDGVAAMRPARKLHEGVMLARPLLWATKDECSALLRALRIPVSEDETNADTRLPRNALRAMLRELNHRLPGASRGIARSAALLADDKELLDRVSAAAWRRARIASDSSDLSASSLRRLPTPLLRRVIRYAIAMSGAGLKNFSFEHCNAIAKAIKQRRGGGYHAGQTKVALSAGRLCVQTASTRRSDAFDPILVDLANLQRGFATPLGTASMKIIAARDKAVACRRASTSQFLDLRALRSAGSVELRLPRRGDTCIPTGRTRPVSLARFLGKAGVPKSRRERVLLLCAGGRIAAVLGVRAMEPFRPEKQGPLLEVGWQAADT